MRVHWGEQAMLQDSRFGRLLALVVLVAGLVGCSPLPLGSESSSKANAVMGERLSSSQGAPLPTTASAFASTQNKPAPATAPAFESTMVASAATDAPAIASPAKTRLASQKVASAATDSP